MSRVARVLVAACVAALAARAGAESVCSDDFYGVLEGTPHKLPEHYLMPRIFDWAVAVPPVCQGELVAGMEARVCTWISPPTIRIVDFTAALVHRSVAQPSYTSVNITVYCAPQLVVGIPGALPPAAPTPAPAPAVAPADPAAPAPALDTASGELTQPLDRQLRAMPMLRSSRPAYWSLR